jgi:hypothetical protein
MRGERVDFVDHGRQGSGELVERGVKGFGKRVALLSLPISRSKVEPTPDAGMSSALVEHLVRLSLVPIEHVAQFGLLRLDVREGVFDSFVGLLSGEDLGVESRDLPKGRTSTSS